LTAGKQETDERLLVEAAQRDPRRFAELYELHFHRVYAYAALRVGKREEAEDIVCPKCQSRRAKKMMSVPAAAVMNSGESFGSCDGAGGCGCSGGACGMS